MAADLFDDVTGIILVGGKSRRMGADKALLPVESEPLAERVARVFRAVVPRIILVGGPVERFAHLDLPVVEDIFPGSALGGLYTGLHEAGTPHVCVAPCDMPFPDAALMRHLISQRTGHDVVVARRGDLLEPLFAVYGRACLPVMRRLLEERRYRIDAVYREVRVRYVEGPELEALDPAGKAFVNVNTPEEYRQVTGDGAP